MSGRPLAREPNPETIVEPSREVAASEPLPFRPALAAESGTDAATGVPDAFEDDYRSRLRAAIVAERSYPRLARRRREEGTAVIGFRVLADGSVERLTIGTSSGVASLDDAALEAVRRVGRFEPFPETMDMAHLDVSVPISFRLSP